MVGRSTGTILVDMAEELEPLPHGLEHIEGIADRLHGVLLELQDANRANFLVAQWCIADRQNRHSAAETRGWRAGF